MTDEREILFDLMAESLDLRLRGATVSDSDIAVLLARLAALSVSGRILHPKTGMRITVSPATARALFGVAPSGRNAVWDPAKYAYRIGRQEVNVLVVKGASMASVNQANAAIHVLADRLMGGQIGLEEWYQAMKQEVKLLHMAQTALARGGVENMRAQDWTLVEKLVAEHWNGVPGEFRGLRAFAEDVQRGRYGRDVLSRQVLSRSAMYAQAGRATYENQRVAVRLESGKQMKARRVRGFVDSCPDCVEWADMGWIDAKEMEAEYPIGSSVCGANCYCIIEMRTVEQSGSA